MNLNVTLPRTISRTRRTSLGLVFASVILGSTLTACGGSEADNTTCGELKGMSTDEVFDFVADAAADEGGDDAEAAAEQFDAVPDDQRDLVAESFQDTICAGESDDTKLKDTSFAE